MDLYDFFALPTVALPKSRSDNRPFDAYLQLIFSEYLDAMAGLDDSDAFSKFVKESRPRVEELALNLQYAVAEYLKGFPHAAYERLRQAIVGVGGALNLLQLRVGHDPGMREYERLYRIRVGKLSAFGRGDLFHVPFQSRILVKSQRFSIPGLPALYLAGSLWTCWEEMLRPDFHTIHASRFRYREATDVLDFGFRPEYLARLKGSTLLSSEVLQAYAICWPLVAACSIRAFAPGMPFIPEYIIPQLLLQWLRNETKLDGLRYFSTRIRQEHHSPWAAMNYVFPVRKQASEGYCTELQDKFFLTAPCAWSILTRSDFVDVAFRPENWSIAVNEDHFVAYFNTEFFHCEHKLEGLDCKDVAGVRQIILR